MRRLGLVWAASVVLCGGCFNPPARPDGDASTTDASTTTALASTADPSSTSEPATSEPEPTTTTTTTGDPAAFRPDDPIPVNGAHALGVGRFDAVAGLDIVVTSTKSGLTFLGGADQSQVVFLPAVPAAYALAVTDFADVDGVDDIVLAAANGTLAAYRSQPGQDPDLEWSVQGPCGASSLVLADLVGDTHLDLTFICPGVASFYTLTGDGGPDFAATVQYSVELAPAAVAVADVVGEPFVDVLLPGVDKDLLAVYRGAGKDMFTLDPADQRQLPAPRAVAVADTVDAPARHDTVVAGAGGCTYLPGGLVTFGEPTTFDCGAAVVALALADLDGDGLADLAALDNDLAAPALRLYRRVGAGDFTPLGVLATTPDPNHLVIADLDDDARPDIVVSSGGHVQVFRNDL